MELPFPNANVPLKYHRPKTKNGPIALLITLVTTLHFTSSCFLTQPWMQPDKATSKDGKAQQYCQGTPAVVPTRASIRMSTLNKGSSSDPGMRSIVGHARARTSGIRYIYQGPQQMLSADCDTFGLTAIRWG
jgi:hypothetical protein